VVSGLRAGHPRIQDRAVVGLHARHQGVSVPPGHGVATVPRHRGIVAREG
jgi:hypothetical protein